VDVDAEVSDSAIADGCRIEASARVERSVLLPGVVVGDGARVKDSVLGEGVRIESEVQVSAATIADHEVVTQGVSA
jgi:ADP-glucose pyrophosphorylase